MKVASQIESSKQPRLAGTNTVQATDNKIQNQDAMSEGDPGEAPVAGAVVMPDFRGMSMRRVLQVMEKRNINIKLLGSGRAAEQSPPPGHMIKAIDEVWIKFAPAA
jgi:cell division protein FtsI (penicillin-binding protein 3)